MDVSVAAKWFLAGDRETLADHAFALLDKYDKGEVRFVVPDLFWAEFANVIWKAIRQSRLSEAAGEDALAALMERDFPSVPSLKLLGSALKIATAFERTVYDSLYVALAVQTNSQLITADERLANSLAAHFPVKWLGSI